MMVMKLCSRESLDSCAIRLGGSPVSVPESRSRTRDRVALELRRIRDTERL